MFHTQYGIIPAIILAGGLGTRLRSVVSEVPKPMAPLNGRPFLEYLLDYWIAQGVRHFILSIGYRSELITAHFGESYCGARIEYSIETEPLGTGGGLFLAMDLLPGDDTFLLLNGDTFFEVSLNTLMDFHHAQQSGWTLALSRANETGRYMEFVKDLNGRILSISSNSTCGERLVNGGVYLISPNTIRIANLTETAITSLEDDVIPYVLAAGERVFGLKCEGRFIDIGLPRDYLRAAELIYERGAI